jgi:lipopolysaccharide export system protein LptA
VGTRDLGLERARRHKWLTGLLVGGIAITALAVGITYWGGTTNQKKTAHVLPSPAPDVHQQLSGYSYTQNDKGQPVFTIHAARTVSYRQNKFTVLEDVTVEVFGRNGDRGDTLRTHRCEYDPLTGDFLAPGPVQIELSAHSSNLPGTGLQGRRQVVLETSKVTYHQKDALAESDEPVQFHAEAASGTAQGMAYATRDGWLELKRNVIVDIPQKTATGQQSPIHLTASALRYDKDGGRVALTGPVEVKQGDRRAVSDNATVALDEHNRVSRVNLEGQVKAFDVNSLRSVELNANRVQGDFDPDSGQLRHLTAEQNVVGESKGKESTSRFTAERMDMDLAGKHPQPLQGVAKGNVHIDLESHPVLNVPDKTAAVNAAGKAPVDKGSEKKTLTAAEVRFDFRPDAHSLKHAETVGPGTLSLIPADPKTGGKVISAGQFLMDFDARSRIESLQGLAPTEVQFRPTAADTSGGMQRLSQISQADHLDATFNSGTQTLREVQQSGNFKYRDGDRQASADNAQYDAQAQTMLLLGHPQVWDTNSRIKCQKITIDMPTDTSIGEGKVQATHLPSPAPGASSATPVLPTNVLADKMVARRQSQTVHYEGHVRAWRGTDVVESSALDVFRAQKRVSSGLHVVTSYLQPDMLVSASGSAPHSSGEPRPAIVHADFLEYFDQGRQARYRGNVRMVTESTTLQSDRLDVRFTQGDTVEGSEVDHAEADGHVKVTQPGRVGSSDHAEYYAGLGKIVLTGGPPRLEDEERGSTTGQRLTFFIHDDRLFVDGGDQSPTLSKHRVAP